MDGGPSTSFESRFSMFHSILHVIEHGELLYLVFGVPHLVLISF